MKYRADQNDWFPKRLKDSVSLEKPLTKFIDFGFETKIPDLKISEKIYLHYLIATNFEKNNIENGNSTWFVVEKTKTELDEVKKHICQ